MFVSFFWWILGLISIAYFTGYIVWVGVNNSFTFFWLIAGIFSFGIGFLHWWMRGRENVWYHNISVLFSVIMACALVAFLLVLGLVIKAAGTTPDKNADYVIVLGAHVYGERMSANLKYRVQLAETYLKENENTKVILSGGQGHGEKISEAQAMYRYLTKQGIAKERILLEEDSMNTEQNIQNSMKKAVLEKKKVIIVSNDFHVYRAMVIAKKLGLQDVQGLGSKTHTYTAVNCYTREVFAVIKYKLCGQI